MSLGEFYEGMQALDVVQVKRAPNGDFTGLIEGEENLPVVTLLTLHDDIAALAVVNVGGDLHISGDINLLGVLNYTSHTVGFRDMLSPLTTAGVGAANRPLSANFGTAIAGDPYQALAFALNDYAFATAFHVDHDVKPGGKAYLHVHWSTNGTSIATVKWQMTVRRSKGHNQANFTNTEQVFTVEQAAQGTAWRHMVTETAAFITLTEPDELIMVTIKRITNGGTNNADTVFGLMCDLHYESDREVTPNKAPNFYGP